MQGRSFGWSWIAAFVATLGCHVAWSHYATGGRQRAVLITTSDIAAGEPITRASLDVRELPERYVDDRQVRRDELERVVGNRAAHALTGGESLLWSDLEVTPRVRNLASLVPIGMRAFALPDAELDFAGLLRPGDRVDVLFTRASTDAVPDTVENALVLSVGQHLGDELETPAEASGRVTLSVSREQAERLAAWLGQGTFRLTLRHPNDVALLEEGLISHAVRGAP